MLLLVALFGSFDLRSETIDLGKLGRVYDIGERDMLELMMERLRRLKETGEIEKMQSELQKRARKFADSPSGVKLPRASEYKVLRVDPVLRLSGDIRGAKGEVLYPKGMDVNPLKFKSLSRMFCFLDGSDPDQVKWANQNCRDPMKSKVVLVNGSIGETSRSLKTRIYFDQDASLTKRFQISAVPATVRQMGDALYVEMHRI